MAISYVSILFHNNTVTQITNIQYFLSVKKYK